MLARSLMGREKTTTVQLISFSQLETKIFLHLMDDYYCKRCC